MVVVLVTATAPGTIGASDDAASVDAAWLASQRERLDARMDGIVDVAIADDPDRHVAVLADGETPEALDLHDELPTRIYDVSDAVPITHGPVMPVMLRTAFQVPSEIRPGSWMIEPAACTLAHIVEDAMGDLYALTAGHCVDTGAPNDEDVGRTVTIVTDASPTGYETLDIGHVVAFENSGPGDDWALVAIDEGLEDRVDPNMVGWHGPTGLATEPEQGTLHHYGFGSGATWTTDATRCRTGVTDGTWGAATYTFHGLVAFGDSGSPAQSTSGQALGINTHLVPGSTSGLNLGTRTTWAIDQLEDRTGLELSIVTGDAQRLVCQVT